MRTGKKLHIELPKGKGLQTVMSLLLLFLCAGSFAFGGSWRGSGEKLFGETDVQATVNAGEVSREPGALIQQESSYGVTKESGEGSTNTGHESNNASEENQDYHIVLDAGHGAKDSGKVGINGALEKDINLSIVGYLQELLQKEGVKVTLTRADDLPLYEEAADNKKMSDMKHRIQTIEAAAPHAVISIHQNSYTDASVRGPQVFYYTGSTTGEQLAACIQNRFTDLIGEENRRKVKANKDYYLLLHTPVPTVIVECGFLSNPEEAGRLITEEYQQGVAKVVAQGIIDWLQDMN